jgi:hypothetical protein
MNYVKFLKHHVPIADFIEEVDETKRKPFSSNNQNSKSRISSDRNENNELSNKLKRKVIIFKINLKYFLLN